MDGNSHVLALRICICRLAPLHSLQQSRMRSRIRLRGDSEATRTLEGCSGRPRQAELMARTHRHGLSPCKRPMGSATGRHTPPDWRRSSTPPPAGGPYFSLACVGWHLETNDKPRVCLRRGGGRGGAEGADVGQKRLQTLTPRQPWQFPLLHLFFFTY